MRTALYQAALILVLKSLPAAAAAEEFKYYVWMDDQGIVHAEQEPPKGVDYEVRVIEDINANVVPVEDFRLYGDLPVDYGADSESTTAGPDSGPTGSGKAAAPQDSDAQR